MRAQPIRWRVDSPPSWTERSDATRTAYFALSALSVVAVLLATPHRWLTANSPYHPVRSHLTADYLLGFQHVARIGNPTSFGFVTAPVKHAPGNHLFLAQARARSDNGGRICMYLTASQEPGRAHQCLNLSRDWRGFKDVAITTKSDDSVIFLRLQASGTDNFDAGRIEIRDTGSDHTPPDLSLNHGSKPTLAFQRDPSQSFFRLTSKKPGTALTCVLDGGRPTACGPAVYLVNVTPGYHRLEVIARDVAGNTTTKRYHWTVKLGVPNGSFDHGTASWHAVSGTITPVKVPTSGLYNAQRVSLVRVDGKGVSTATIRPTPGRYEAIAWVTSPKPLRVCLTASNTKTACIHSSTRWQQIALPVHISNRGVSLAVTGTPKGRFLTDSVSLTPTG